MQCKIASTDTRLRYAKSREKRQAETAPHRVVEPLLDLRCVEGPELPAVRLAGVAVQHARQQTDRLVWRSREPTPGCIL